MNQLKQIRTNLGITNVQLAAKLGVSLSHCESLIAGRYDINRASLAVRNNYRALIKRSNNHG